MHLSHINIITYHKQEIAQRIVSSMAVLCVFVILLRFNFHYFQIEIYDMTHLTSPRIIYISTECQCQLKKSAKVLDLGKDFYGR